MTPARVVLGIDPGSVVSGYGIVEARGTAIRALGCGVIRTRPDALFVDRLLEVFDGVTDVIGKYHPTEVAIESVFVSKNPSSALKLGQARGAAIVACRRAGLPVREFSPREVKSALTGFGAATKEQVADMAKRLLGLSGTFPLDATDALAVAFCSAGSRDFSALRPARGGPVA